ncbi:lyase family protein [Methylomicrobium sp. Wu6]|uniref:lyase family protein n=1 Tax=Methylomicrobium sp. Wu6 TaxID=3107928 RepID=UPI002DD6692C|nr:lyase family protein [Methylomicrobium sp. Wu6]MEC4749540.1 lyase family protein [Methylomicrobium sp. Wu6]
MTARHSTEPLPQQVLEIGARLKAPPSDLLVNSVFAQELAQQLHLFDALGITDIAQTLVALELGSIPETEGRALLAALLELQKKPDDFVPCPERGDIYTNREAWLSERSAAAGWLGAGRARREAITTAFVIVMRKALLDNQFALSKLGGVMIERAMTNRLSIMPDYTYLQAAQPTTFGHYLLSFAYPLLRDLERLDLLFSQLNLSPVGCGSTNGSLIPQGRQQAAQLLGFAGVIEHARDAMWQADVCINCVSILNTGSVTLSRLAEDLQIFSTQEFGLIELDDRHARASKIMPQKKNPFALTHVRAFANKMIGFSATVTASSRTPSGQPDNRLLIYGELPEAVLQATEVSELMAELLEHLTFKADRGLHLIESGWALATDLAETLVLECGLDFRAAHQLVGFLASEFQGHGLRTLSPDIIISACEQRFGRRIELSRAQLEKALDPLHAIESRQEAGGTSMRSMENMLNDCSAQFTGYREQVRQSLAYLEDKEKELLMLAEALAAT